MSWPWVITVVSLTSSSTAVRWHSSSIALSLALIWPFAPVIKKCVLALPFSNLDTNNPHAFHVCTVVWSLALFFLFHYLSPPSATLPTRTQINTFKSERWLNSTFLTPDLNVEEVKEQEELIIPPNLWCIGCRLEHNVNIALPTYTDCSAFEIYCFMNCHHNSVKHTNPNTDAHNFNYSPHSRLSLLLSRPHLSPLALFIWLKAASTEPTGWVCLPCLPCAT